MFFRQEEISVLHAISIRAIISRHPLLLIARDGKTGQASRMDQQSRSQLVGLGCI